MTVEEILADLGVQVDPAKAASLASWNGKLTAAQTEAQKKLEDAQALQRVIDENIRTAGLTETNLAQLQANNAALTAALESVKSQGFTGLNIPALPQPAAKDPVKELTDKLMGGFAAMGQTMNETARYQRVFGTPIPEDPATIPDRAIAAGFKNVRDYMESTYKVSAKEQELTAQARQKELDAYAAKQVEAYKAANPVTLGHPELGGMVPSNYPNIPKPSDAAGVRDMAGKSPMEKIRMARDRVSGEIKTRLAAA